MANWVPVSPTRPQVGIAGQNISFTGTSAASAAFGSQTYMVRVSATANCHVSVGMAPVAVTTDMLVKATDPPCLIKVSPGEKIAVIQDSAAGTLNISEQTF